MELFSPGHLVVIAIVAAVLFFGWKQLPDMSRSLGRSLRIFRTELKGMSEDDSARAAASAPAAQAPAPAVPAAPAPVDPAPVAPAVTPAPAASAVPAAPAAPASGSEPTERA